MEEKNRSNNLEEKLFDCRVVLFGKPDLYWFIDALNLRDSIVKKSPLNYSDIKILKDGSIAEFGFYAFGNRYEISEEIKNEIKGKGLGFSYKIKSLKEIAFDELPECLDFSLK